MAPARTRPGHSRPQMHYARTTGTGRAHRTGYTPLRRGRAQRESRAGWWPVNAPLPDNEVTRALSTDLEVVRDAWDEPMYEPRPCFYCGEPFTPHRSNQRAHAACIIKAKSAYDQQRRRDGKHR